MIFNKEVVFPYPVLAPFNDDYEDKTFIIDVEFKEHPNNNDYEFFVNMQLNSEYLSRLLQKNLAKILVVIQGKDSKTFVYNDKGILVPKNRISLQKRTSIQLMIVSNEEISFKENYDLHPVYNGLKSNIIVVKNQVLALSRVERFDGDLKKPYDLFTHSVNENLDSELKFELKNDTINIVVKDKKYLYPGRHHQVNYHYVYMGLQRALTQFFLDFTEDNKESLIVDDMELPEGLNLKLYNLMRSKGIQMIDLENIDLVIHQLTDKLVATHYKAIIGSNE